MNREVHVPFWESVGLRCPALLAYLKAYESLSQARAGIAWYMNFFNAERRHYSLERRIPDAVYDESLGQRRAA